MNKLGSNAPSVNHTLAGRSVDEIKSAIAKCDAELQNIRNSRKELRKRYQDVEAVREKLVNSLPEYAKPKRGRPAN